MTDEQDTWFPAWRGRLAAHRTARRALEALLDGMALDGPAAVIADLARGTADLVDSARRLQDPRLMLAATVRLDALVGKLAGVPTAGRFEGVDDDGAAALAELVGREASMGDEAES